MLARRRFPRTKVFKGAKLILAGRPTVSCIVRDLSNHGACLHLPSTVGLPFPPNSTFRSIQAVHCENAASLGRPLTNVGVSFEQPTTR